MAVVVPLKFHREVHPDAQQLPADSHTLLPSLLFSLWVVPCKAAALQVSVTLPVQPVNRWCSVSKILFS